MRAKNSKNNKFWPAYLLSFMFSSGVITSVVEQDTARVVADSSAAMLIFRFNTYQILCKDGIISLGNAI